MLWRHLTDHEACLAQAAAVDGFDVVTTVPSSDARRDATHPLHQLVGELVTPLTPRYARLLRRTDTAVVPHRFHAERYRAGADLSGGAVLLIDDTWTTGANAQSAAAALKAAGADRVAALVIGRYLNREWGHNDRQLRRLRRPFDWRRCALCGGAGPAVPSTGTGGGLEPHGGPLGSQRHVVGAGGHLPGLRPLVPGHQWGRRRRSAGRDAAAGAHRRGWGRQAVWLSPIYPSPNADFGYDVSDFCGVEPAFGTLADLDALVSRAHELGLKVLLDFVPCHTSTEHPWFRGHPDYYVWADAPVNNWRAAFGGSSWGHDEQTGRYFLHSFFPEQADLNWRNPEVREQMTAAMRFWVDRGIDGFRLDALDRLMKDPELRDDPPATRPFALPGDPTDLELDHIHSRNAPDLGDALKAIRRVVGDVLLIGEVYLPIEEAAPYLETLDVVFNFEELFAVGDAAKLRDAIEAGLRTGGQGWVLSNHDFSRLVSRAGAENAPGGRPAAAHPPRTRVPLRGRRVGLRRRGDGEPRAGPQPARPLPRPDGLGQRCRTRRLQHRAAVAAPPSSPGRGRRPAERGSHLCLTLTRRAMALRPRLDAHETRLLPSEPGTIVLQRGDHVVAINLSDAPAAAPARGELILEARRGDGADLSVIPAHGGWVAHLA